MADRSVAIRLGTTGAADVKRDLTAIGDTGDAQAKRWSKAYDAAGAEVEAAMQRQARAAEKIAAVMPQPSTPAIYQAGASTNYDGASARDSAAAIRELLAEEEALEAKARALINVLEPLRAAQNQYNVAVAEASRLHDAGKISIEQFLAAENLAAAALERTTGATRSAAEAEAALQVEYARRNGSADTVIVGKSAEDSAHAFDELLGQEEALQKRVDALRASIDPTATAQARFNVEIGEARALVSQGAISLDEYCAKLRLEQGELDAATGGLKRHAGGFGGMGIAGMEAEHVVRAFTDSIAAGQSPVRAFAMEVPRVSEAMMFWSQTAGQTEGKMAALAGFMGGPWGLALSVGLAVLGPLVEKLFEGGDASDKLKAKSLALEDALRKEAIATEEAKKALDDYNAKQDEARKNDSLAIDNQLKLADARLKDAIATREQTKAKLAAALADEAQARQVAQDQLRYGKSDAGVFALQNAEGRTEAIQAQLSGEDASIGVLQQTQRNLLVQQAGRTAAEAVDPVKKLNDQYDQMRDRAIRAASANTALAQSLGATRTKIEQARKAAVDAEKDREKADAKAAKSGSLTDFLTPVTGYRVTGKFGESRPGHMHAGVDLAVPVGTPVRAPASGTVDVAGERSGYGNAIYINFGGGTSARFGHLAKFNVKPGDTVEAGDIIGYTGGAAGAAGSGDSTGPHLHYEVRQGNKAVNPLLGRYRTDSGKADDDAQHQADQAAQEQARDLASVQNQFDLSAKAAREYKDALEEIGKAKLDPATAARYTEAAHDAFVQARASAFTLGDVEDTRPAYDANDKAEKERQAQQDKNKQFLDRLTTDQGDALAESQADLGLVRQTNAEHDRQIAKLELIQQLKENGIDLDSDDAKQRLAVGDAIETNREKLKLLQDDWNEIKQTGEQFLNDLTNPDGSGIKNLLKDIEQEFIKLALLNPLKNLLFHDNAPTLGSVFGSLGSLFGGPSKGTQIDGAGTSYGDVLSGVESFGHNASGTENWSGGKTWINENGPELVDLPSGTRIIPAAATSRMLANDNSGGRIKVDIGLNTDLFTATVAQTADGRVAAAAPVIGNGAADLANARSANQARRRMR